MIFSRFSSHFFAYAWGIKDFDFSQFLVNQALRELSLKRTLLDELVLRRVKNIVRHAEESSKYYSKKFSDCGLSYKQIFTLDDLKKFPILTKDNLRESLSEIVCGREISPSWKKSATGGTTSSPVVFYCNRKALWKKNAFSKAIDTWYGRRLGDRTVYLWGAMQDLGSKMTFGMRLRNLTYRASLILPSSPLDRDILADYVKKVSDWSPEFLQAYPSALYEFCNYLRDHDLHFPSLRSASVTAEVLDQTKRKFIEETLGFKVYNWYGSRELGRVASECYIHDGLHINEPSVYLEIEPDTNLPENYGHLIVTDLFNRATPLIRYKTGDIARLRRDKCPCGSSLYKIDNVVGRITDFIILPGGRKVRVSNTCDVREFREIQIVQRSMVSFLVRYVKGDRFSEFSLKQFYSSFQKITGPDTVLNFEEVNFIPRSQSGKILLVINEMGSCEVK